MSTEDAELPRAPRVEGPPPHLLIVRAPYYREVVDGLTAGAYRILRRGRRHRGHDRRRGRL